MTKPTYLKTILLFFGLILFQSAMSYSQSSQSDLKLDEFDPKTEDAEAFKRKATAFLNGLSSYSKDTTGHVNVSPNDTFGKALLQLAGNDFTARLVLLLPGTNSRNVPEKIEFWIVPKGSENPFPVICGLCECPTAQVIGKSRLDGSEA